MLLKLILKAYMPTTYLWSISLKSSLIKQMVCSHHQPHNSICLPYHSSSHAYLLTHAFKHNTNIFICNLHCFQLDGLFK